jgi:hypothetical protein
LIFGVSLNGSRTGYLEILAQSGILDEYPVAVVDMAIYAFISRNCLGYAKHVALEADAKFTVSCARSE